MPFASVIGNLHPISRSSQPFVCEPEPLLSRLLNPARNPELYRSLTSQLLPCGVVKTKAWPRHDPVTVLRFALVFQQPIIKIRIIVGDGP